ncbi:pyridine nucleotide-disulfide oxidoreductase [Candidatus Bathyarchaeota archaeon]|nr:MAG: pyridine nucleotide-disulfide oxidoreductase [Candidatus Bathyarchaeota archaeon]
MTCSDGKFDVVIVGGGAGGYTAALTVKKLYPDISVLLVRKDSYALIPCAIPYLCATIEACNRNLLPDAPLKKAGVEILIDEVVDIDLTNKLVKTAEGREIGYGKLILATGSSPVVPRSIKGTDLEGVYTVVKSFKAMERLQDAVRKAERITIVGGGFIGVEFADDLANLKKKITIVELLPHCLMLNFDEEFAVEAEDELRAKGVDVITNARVESIVGDGKVEAVRLADGREIPSDVVIMAVGARPNSELAKKAGLKIGERGAIVVDEYMRTSNPDVLAVGDCAEKRSFFTGKPVNLMLASIACYEARVAGINLFDIRIPKPIRGVVGIFLTYINGKAFGAAGLTESMARREGFQVESSVVKVPNRHPGILPGARETKLKLVFSKQSGLLLGAEASGGEDVAELVNFLGLAIQNRMNAKEISILQYGTQPFLTPSPVGYPPVVAALNTVKFEQ